MDNNVRQHEYATVRILNPADCIGCNWFTVAEFDLASGSTARLAHCSAACCANRGAPLEETDPPLKLAMPKMMGEMKIAGLPPDPVLATRVS